MKNNTVLILGAGASVDYAQGGLIMHRPLLVTARFTLHPPATGGSQGIGLDTAIMLKSKGAVAIINARDKSRLDAATKEHGLVTIQGDVSKESDVKRIYSFVMEQYGKLDALINNARAGALVKQKTPRSVWHVPSGRADTQP